MNLKDLIAPAWRHSNPEIRLRAIQKNKYDEIILCQIIKNNREEKEIIFAAINQLTNVPLCEKLFIEVYGSNAEEIRKNLLRKIVDEQRISTLYRDIRKKGGLSFLEIALEMRLFEIWKEQIEKTKDPKALINIIEKSASYVQGSYVSVGAYQVVENAIQKVTDLPMLASWVEKEFLSKRKLHYSIRNGLFERLKQDDARDFFDNITNIELLLILYKGGKPTLGLGAEARLKNLGKKVRVEERVEERKCSSCGGAGGGDVRVPYTDHDWQWEKCEPCKGTGQETNHIKEYFVENI
jgi:hypothetical protein